MSRMEEKDKAGVPKEDFETARDIATDSIPGVSETKDIISLSSNIGKGDYVGAGIDATALALGAFPILGDVARQGFKRITKQLRDKDIKEAKNLIDNDIAAEKWKEANKLAEQQRQKRNPKIQKEVDKLSQGLTTSKKYRSVVKAEQPIKPITKDNFPEMPTKTDIVGALKATDPRKINTGIVGINKKIEDGTRVGSRLDIPSYDNYDKWIVSLHDGTKKGGNAIGYGQTALLKNVEFVSSAKGGLNIAKGKPKATIARIHGDYYNAEPELVYESAKKLIDNPEWTQVGMNPFKHSYFYNKATGMPVTRADEVIQVGPLVLAKGVKKPTISELKELKIKTQDGKIRMFNEGGTTMKKQMELFEDGGLKDEGGMIDEVSGNDVPPGSTREEVRDDIPAQLSEGEFVFPADVVRYIGLEKLMMMRQEAKQGLKAMEAMGQMGNSDEATMPDDLPFDETDLDMEDELEYNEGGVVQAQQGTYVAPTVPTGTQQLGTTPMGAPPIPQQVGAGVSGTSFGTPYVPNVGQMYGAQKAPYAPVSYQQLLGPSAAGAPQTKNVRYVNEATNQTRMIPHLLNADGTIGDTLYPVPQGFVRKDEAPKEESKKTQVQTAKVKPVDTGDGPPSDDSKGGASISFGGTPDPNNPGLQQNAITANISYNVSALGGILGLSTGLGKISDINKGKDVQTTGNQYGKTTNPVELSFGKGKPISLTSKQYATVKNAVYGKEAKDLKSRLEVLDAIGSKEYSFNPTTNTYTDKLGNTLSFDEAQQAGKDINSYIDTEISKGRDMKSIIDNLTQTEISVAQDASIEAEDDQQTYGGGFDFGATQPGQDVTTSFGVGTDIDDDDDSFQNNDNNDGGFSDVSDDAGPSDDDSAGLGGEDVYKGSLITKRKASGKTKKKYMKRGGLASR